MLNASKKINMSLIIIQLALFFVLSSILKIAAYTDEEVFKSAKEKGKIVADYLVKSSGIAPNSPSYFDVCSYYGACLFDEAIKDTASYKSIHDRYKQSKPSRIQTDNIDNNAGGILPLHLFLYQQDAALLKLGKDAADYNISKNGWVRNAIDDTYMTGSLMVQAYRATKDTKYLDFGANFITDYMKKLQQSNGLFWHKLDSKNYWGRGNGWGASSTTELLQELPTTHAKYAEVLDGYKKQMNGLLAVQRESGMWMQLLDSKASNNWEESSGTAMFLFAIFTGLKNGWLEKATFLEPAKKGWTALAGYLQNGKLTNVAAGFWPSVNASASEYLGAARGSAGDSHGTAGFLWAATAAVNYFAYQTSIKMKPVSPSQSIQPSLPSVGKNACFDILGRTIAFTGKTDQPATPFIGTIIRQGTETEKKYDVSFIMKMNR